MADRQYPPLAEPLTLPPALDPPTPQLPWLNAVLVPKPRLKLEGLAGPPPIALPYDFPLEEVARVPVRRVVLTPEAYAQPVAPLPYDLPITPPPDVVRARRSAPQWDRTFVSVALPYDLPLLTPTPLVLRAPLLPQSTASTAYGQADVVAAPDLIAMNLVSPLPRPRALLDSGGGQVPLLSIAFAGDLTSTVVAGTLPIAILPSGMTPGVDADG